MLPSKILFLEMTQMPFLVIILLPEVDALPEYVEVAEVPVPPNTNLVSVDHC